MMIMTSWNIVMVKAGAGLVLKVSLIYKPASAGFCTDVNIA